MATLTTLVAAPISGTSDANGLNDAGEVVGQDDATFPFVWQPTTPNGTSGTATRLPILPTGASPGTATAFAISTSGVIAGTSDVNGIGPGGIQLSGAVAYNNGGSPTPLLPVHSEGYDVGLTNVVVGTCDAPGRGFTFHPSTGLVDVTALVATSGATVMFATGVNSVGQITALANVGGNAIGVLITP